MHKVTAVACRLSFLTEHEVSDDGEEAERNQSHRYEVAEHFGEEICRYAIEPTRTLVAE